MGRVGVKNEEKKENEGRIGVKNEEKRGGI